MKKSVFALLALVSGAALPGGAQAKKIDAITPFLALGSAPPPQSKTFRKNETVLETKAVYALLAEAGEDIYGYDGGVQAVKKLLATKGDQLFGVVAANGQVTYCRIDNKTVGALDGLFVINSDKHTCFIDEDKDGRFDASYDLRTKWIVGGPPSYFDVEAGGNRLFAPAKYVNIDPLLCKLDFRLEAYVSRIYSGGMKARVNFRMATEKSVNMLGDQFEIDISKKNAVSHYGALFSVEEDGPSTVKILFDRGFSAGKFTTNTPRFSYYVY